MFSSGGSGIIFILSFSLMWPPSQTLLTGEALWEMQDIAEAVASERARLKARKGASARSAAEEAVVSDEAEASLPTAEAYFRQRISNHTEEADQNHEALQVYC